jgi:hypothetical protein
MKRAACLIFLGCFLGCLLGCAAGRGPAGEIVVGWDVASLPETANESIAALGDMLIPGLGLAGAGIITPIAMAIRNSAKRRSAEVRAAALEGANDGWDERERAAAVQSPLAASVPAAPVAGAVPPVA